MSQVLSLVSKYNTVYFSLGDAHLWTNFEQREIHFRAIFFPQSVSQEPDTRLVQVRNSTLSQSYYFAWCGSSVVISRQLNKLKSVSHARHKSKHISLSQIYGRISKKNTLWIRLEQAISFPRISSMLYGLCL
jgi:hypothetical protein